MQKPFERSEGEWDMEIHQDFQVALRTRFILYFFFFFKERRVNIVDTLVFSLGEAVGTEEADTLFTKTRLLSHE